MIKLIKKYDNISILKQFRVYYIILMLIIIPTIFTMYWFYGRIIVMDILTEDMINIVAKGNQISDIKLELAKDYAFGLAADTELWELLAEIERADSVPDKYFIDKEVIKLINKYTLYSSSIYSLNVYFKGDVYGLDLNKNYVPQTGFEETELYKMSRDEEGSLIWIPTYKFADMYRQHQLDNISIDYEYMFSAVKWIKNPIWNVTQDEMMLIINFSESIYKEAYKDINEDYRYLIFNQTGEVVSHSFQTSGEDQLIGDISWESLDMPKKSGYTYLRNNDVDYIVAYVKSTITGWTSAIILSKNIINKEHIDKIVNNILITIAIVLLGYVAMETIIKRVITNPMDKFINAINQLGRDDHSRLALEERGPEFKKLIHTFNEMHSRIEKLNREKNEKIELWHKSEIRAINMQLNPHFLYNTLNIINMELIKNKQYQTSEMIDNLGEMLKYTLNSRNYMEKFAKDMEYTKRYIQIINRRNSNKYEIHIDIDEGINDTYVPKFMLQPIIENIFVHAFTDKHEDCQIFITCKIEQNHRIFKVTDNGRGLSPGEVRKLNSNRSTKVGISNAKRRIENIYEKNYRFTIESQLGSGTSITIILPL